MQQRCFMPGDAASRNEDELLNQIDELKARMDRLMSGGSSTSNSALLTDKPEATPPPPPAPPEPSRTRVRDLVETDDTEVIEVYPGPKEVVPFPDKNGGKARDESPQVEETAIASEPVGGSVISVEEDAREQRPQVATFDDLGSAIQHELERDESIPRVEGKKGPDLASRFGSVDEPAARVDEPVVPAGDTDVVDQDDEDEPEVAEFNEPAEPSPVPEAEVDDYSDDSGRRGATGKVAAIWLLTAVVSGAIATLHFTGII